MTDLICIPLGLGPGPNSTETPTSHTTPSTLGSSKPYS